MSSLILSFSDFYTKVSEFLGWGSSPSSTNLTKAKGIVYSGYRNFLFPLDARTGRKHTWSFLKKLLVIVTQSGKWKYALPSDFKELRTQLQYDADSGYYPPEKVSVEKILELRAIAVIDSYPSHYALIKSNYNKDTGNSWEIWFYGEPDGVYTLNGVYIINPEKPTETTDILVGGVEASEAILECCLAAAERFEDDVEGIHNKRAEELVQKLIKQDNADIPTSVGLNLDPGKLVRKRFLEALDADDIYV